MELPTDIKAEKRPGVFVFRHRVPPRQHRRGLLGSLAIFVLLNALAVYFWISPQSWAQSPGALVAMPVALSGLPAIFFVLYCMVPQTVLRVSPRSISHADVYICKGPWVRRRWRIEWGDIDQLWWDRLMFRIRAGANKREIRLAIWRDLPPDAIAAPLKLYLGEYFDLSEGTVRERRRRVWQSWTWKRRLLDRVELLVCGLGICFGELSLLFLMQGPIWVGLLILPLVVFPVCVLIRELRFGWQKPRSYDGAIGFRA